MSLDWDLSEGALCAGLTNRALLRLYATAEIMSRIARSPFTATVGQLLGMATRLREFNQENDQALKKKE